MFIMLKCCGNIILKIIIVLKFEHVMVWFDAYLYIVLTLLSMYNMMWASEKNACLLIYVNEMCCVKIRFYFIKEWVSCMNKNKQNAKKWTKAALNSTATFIQYLQFFFSLVTKKHFYDLGYARRRNRSTISSLTNPTNLKLINCYML